MHKACYYTGMNLCAWKESSLTCAVGRYRNKRIIYTVMKRFYVRKYLDSNSVNVRNMCELYLKEPLTARPIAGCQRGASCDVCKLDCFWNVMAHAQKPDFVFRRNGRVHLNRQGLQFIRLLAAEVCASAVVMLDIQWSVVVWRVLATHSIRQFPLHIPSRASQCAITFQLDSTNGHVGLLYDFTWTTVLKIYIAVQLRFNVPRYILQRKKRRIRLTFCVMKLPGKTVNYYFSWCCF